MGKNELEKLVKASIGNDDYRSSLAVEATELLEYLRINKPGLYEQVLAEAKRLPESKVLVLSPHKPSANLIKTADESEAKYGLIEGKYTLFLERPWDLGLILNKINFVFAGVQNIVNEYGRELVASKPIKIEFTRKGLEYAVQDPEKAFLFLPTKKQQKNDLKRVYYGFNTADEKLSGEILYYNYYQALSTKSWDWRMKVQLSVKAEEFKDQDLEEYTRLKLFIEKGKI